MTTLADDLDYDEDYWDDDPYDDDELGPEAWK